MLHEVIPNDAPIKAGEIRVEAKNYDRVCIFRYSRNLDYNSGFIIAEFNMNDYIMLNKKIFLDEVDRYVVRAHMDSQKIRITQYVIEYFDSGELY